MTLRTHRPVWKSAACLSCGVCTGRCPTRLFSEQALEWDSLRGRVARAASLRAGVFPMLSELSKVPPCQAACPLGQDIPAYIRALARGDSAEALEIILQTNPLPSICGRLCVRACMRTCVRVALDRSVEIRALKRAAAEWSPKTAVNRPSTAAEIGAGRCCRRRTCGSERRLFPGAGWMGGRPDGSRSPAGRAAAGWGAEF